ncbi:MAG: cytochrome C [candidate division Zixibacteria bacterium RBG_16_50_21]|nr:MAG: cytochrome C [candidate division Zixibacteria bacterium RBG_16_50_21]
MGLKTKAAVFLLVVVAYLLWSLAAEINNNKGYSPVQPNPFSHKIHAGDNKIPCLYCHAHAEHSPHATVPAMNVCMGCHNVVATGKAHVVTLRQEYEAGRAIGWIRIHDMPDFVYFSHQQHMAKGIECQTCHGPVETMEKVYQARRLNMGDCVSCHRQNNAPTSCNTCHN